MKKIRARGYVQLNFYYVDLPLVKPCLQIKSVFVLVSKIGPKVESDGVRT